VGQPGVPCPVLRRPRAISALGEGWLAVALGREKLMSASLFHFGGEGFPCLGLQAVDKRVDEGREVVVGWEDVCGDTRVLGDGFGGRIDSFCYQ